MFHDWYALANLLNKINAVKENEEIVIHQEHFSGSLYSWALSVIYSRSTDFQRKNVSSGEMDNIRVIVPLFDMMNHDFESDVYHAMDDNGEHNINY